MSGTKIIAEIGVNHDGDMTQARTLIDVAADAGADFVKFQTFQAEKLTTKSAKNPGYQLTDSSSENSQFELLKRLELSPTEHQSLVEYCQTRGVQFLSTAFDNESLRLLIELDVPILKVPSGEITNLLFLRQVARLGKPIFMSTGMATMSEVHAAV